MEWVEAYLEDPIFQAEALLYLEHNWCDPHHHGELHDPDGHLQHPVRGLQPRLDHTPSHPPTSLYSPTSNTSSHVNLRSRNKLCMHENLLHYMPLLKVPTSLSYF